MNIVLSTRAITKPRPKERLIVLHEAKDILTVAAASPSIFSLLFFAWFITHLSLFYLLEKGLKLTSSISFTFVRRSIQFSDGRGHEQN
jgi:hypothetical protein